MQLLGRRFKVKVLKRGRKRLIAPHSKKCGLTSLGTQCWHLSLLVKCEYFCIALQSFTPLVRQLFK